MKAHALRAVILALVVAVAGCAEMSSVSGTDSSSGGCNSVVTGLIGAAAGALLASDHRAGGAAIGGALGALACMAYNYSTQQKKSADQVEKDYKNQNGALPQQTKVLSYTAALQPGNSVASGSNATLVSDIALVKGQNSPEPKVEESLEMRAPDGKVLNTTRKTAQVHGSGEFENRFNFNLPKGVDEGVYPVDLTLYVDGERKDSRSVRMQVASNGETRWLAAR